MWESLLSLYWFSIHWFSWQWKPWSDWGNTLAYLVLHWLHIAVGSFSSLQIFFIFLFFHIISRRLSVVLGCHLILLLSLLSFFSIFLGDNTKWPSKVDVSITFTFLWANSADCKLEAICMNCQISFAGKNKKKQFNMPSAEIFTQSSKH